MRTSVHDTKKNFTANAVYGITFKLAISRGDVIFPSILFDVIRKAKCVFLHEKKACKAKTIFYKMNTLAGENLLDLCIQFFRV